MQEEEFEKFMNYKEVSEFTGFSVTKIQSWLHKKSFPKAFRNANGDFAGWTKSQLIAWQQSMKMAA